MKNLTLKEPKLAIAIMRTQVGHTFNNLAGKCNLEEIHDLRADGCGAAGYQ